MFILAGNVGLSNGLVEYIAAAHRIFELPLQNMSIDDPEIFWVRERSVYLDTDMVP